MSRRSITTLGLVVALLVTGTAWAEPPGVTYRVEEGRLVAQGSEGPETVPVPCDQVRAMAIRGGRIFLACGADGLVVLDAADPAEIIERRGFDGYVRGFLDTKEELWVEVSRTVARPVREQPGAPALPTVLRGTGPGVSESAAPKSEPGPKVSEAKAPATGKVLESSSGMVVVDLGSKAGLHRKDHVELFSSREVPLGQGKAAREEELLAVGEVTAVGEARAKVKLGLNERVPAGALARKTDAALTSNHFAPPRVADVWDTGFVARPFLAVGSFGLGMVSNLWVSRRTSDNLRVMAMLEPAGIGYADEGNIVATALNLFASFDTRVLEIGLGLGWSAVNEELDSQASSRADAGGIGAIEPTIDEVKSGLSVAQLARLGAQDGLHIVLRNNFILYEDAFYYGGTVGEFQWPLSMRSWLLVRGGGGAAGYGFGEVGMRWLARGNGDSGSMFLTVTAGAGGLRGRKDSRCKVPKWENGEYVGEVERDCTESVSYGGPLVGFGMEWRL